MSHEWEPYIGDRLIRRSEKNFVVIKPIDEEKHAPLFCETCGCLLIDDEDERSYVEFDCCDWCASHWARQKLDDWKMGWRPTKQIVEEALKTRSSMSVLANDAE
jgi:hypothetical protein